MNPAGRLLIVLSLLALAGGFGDAVACSCTWRGPFLDVAVRSEYVVRGTVKTYVGDDPEKPTAMKVEILETYCGDEMESPVVVYGDDGAQCRPPVTQFPVGSEWVFALNGPGSKPDPEAGPAISICGQYWLEVKEEKLNGPLDIRKQDAEQTTTLTDFREKLSLALSRGWSERERLDFTGEVEDGKPFAQLFGPKFVFRLEPIEYGWTIMITEAAQSDDLSRLTPPRHFVVNPRDIEGWHFRNSDNTGPNEPGDKNVNAPGEMRDFIFSPEVGKTIQGPGASAEPSREEIHRVMNYGNGEMMITSYVLDDLEEGHKARMKSMKFKVRLSWPAAPAFGPGAPCSPKPKQRAEKPQ